MKKPLSQSKCRDLFAYAKAVARRPELLSVVGPRPVQPLSRRQIVRLKKTGSPYLRRQAYKAIVSQVAIRGQCNLPL